MLTLEQAETIYKAAKSLRDDVKKQVARWEKNAKLDYRDVSPKRFNKAHVDATWAAMEIDRKEFHLHSVVVKAGLAPAYEDDYYGDTHHRPSSFHTYTFKRPHPLKGQ